MYFNLDKYIWIWNLDESSWFPWVGWSWQGAEDSKDKMFVKENAEKK